MRVEEIAQALEFMNHAKVYITSAQQGMAYDDVWEHLDNSYAELMCALEELEGKL